MDTRIDEIAERLRKEPHHILGFRKSNCIAKSFRFKKECKEIGVDARVVICIGLIRFRPLRFWFTLPVIHGWGEVGGKRIELGRPLEVVDKSGFRGSNVKPLVAIWI
jgi:hypothetical protein